jgi:flagellar hook protein FlgE
VITQPAQPPAKVDEELVNLKVEQFNAKANVATIQTADEVLGTLIDVRV